MSQPTSAIVARVSLPPALERVRRQLDRAAALRVPAHVTILYPWLPAASLTGVARAALQEIAHETATFDVEFVAARRWPRIVYLEPEPAWPFIALIDRVTVRFPAFPPYAGSISEVIPHLTLVENADAPLDEIASAATRRLPFGRTIRAIEVLVEGADGAWSPRWRLPLAGGAG
jgi:hypothetical protein